MPVARPVARARRAPLAPLALLAVLGACTAAPSVRTPSAPAAPPAAALPADAPAGTSVRVGPPGGADRLPPPARGPLTTAERTGYAETSSHADVVAFLDALQQAGATMARGEIGRTGQGKSIPYVIASRPLVRTAAEARATGRPIVYVQGDIHGGEVEGKEALQMLLRDLLLDPRPNVLDSIVLVAVPIYNADGNDAMGPQARQRGSQQGPERIGSRPNAASLDLNRDYIKAEAPETRASLAMFDAWNPDVFVDLHTTNGSYHGYALTYSPSLHPAAPLGRFTHDTLLPDLQARVLARHGYPTYHYGNFSDDGAGAGLVDTAKTGWFTYDHRPRFGTNYFALRGGVSILSEAFSHDPFDRRVASTYAFVRELLSLVAEQGAALTARTRALDASPTDVALRAVLPETGPLAWIVAEDLVRTGDSTVTEAGVPRGVRRTGRWRAIRMPSVVRFAPTMTGDVPRAWVLPARDTAAVALLRRHGVAVERVDAPRAVDVRAYVVDSVARAARPFQGHQEVRLEGGAWRDERRTIAAGSWWVPGDQRLARLALVLLDPRTDDGLVTWNAFDDRLARGAEFPVLRVR